MFHHVSVSLCLLTSEIEVLAVVVGSKVHVLHDVTLGPLGVLALPVFGGLQHRHARVGEVAGEGGLQGTLLCAAQGPAGAAPTPYAALLEDAGQRPCSSKGQGKELKINPERITSGLFNLEPMRLIFGLSD